MFPTHLARQIHAFPARARANEAVAAADNVEKAPEPAAAEMVVASGPRAEPVAAATVIAGSALRRAAVALALNRPSRS